MTSRTATSRWWLPLLGLIVLSVSLLAGMILRVAAEGVGPQREFLVISTDKDYPVAGALPESWDPIRDPQIVQNIPQVPAHDTTQLAIGETSLPSPDPFEVLHEQTPGISIAFDGTNYLVTWEDDHGGSYDIYGARVAPSGTVLDHACIAIHTGAGDQRYPAVAFDGVNYMVVWNGPRAGSGATDIYGARVTKAGVVLDPDGIAISWADNYQWLPTLVFDGTNYLVVWHDYRYMGNLGSCIYGTRLSTTGSVLDPDGIAIAVGPYANYQTDVAFDGSNSLVVWEDWRGSAYDVFGARVSMDGTVLDPGGIPITASPYSDRFPSIVFDGVDYMVVWMGGSNDIFGARVTSNGTVLDPGGFDIAVAGNSQWFPTVASDGTNCLAVWQDNRSGSSDIYGARVSESGQVLDPGGFCISNAPGDQFCPTVEFDGSNYLVVWEDWRSGSCEAYGARLSQSGLVIEPQGFAIVCGAEAVLSATLEFDPDNLNVRSRGRWVTCHIELPEGYGVADIDIASIMLNGDVQAEERPWEIGDYDSDGIDDLMVKFDRLAVCRVLAVGDSVAVTVSGEVGTHQFSGTDYIRVANPPSSKSERSVAMPSPEKVALAVSPNPFNPSVRIEYGVPALARVVVQVWGIDGRLVRALEDVERPRGFYAVEWNGLDGAGSSVPSGVYICRLVVGDEVMTKKLTLLK